MQIGTYMEPGKPRNLEEMKLETYKWKYMQVMVNKPTPVKKLHLVEGLPNQCGCGVMFLKNEFVKHLYDKHKGVAPPDSKVNMPHWIWSVVFDSDEMEKLYCQTLYY